MRIALLSDIHSNVYALEAVIADMKNQSIDITVNLGDILYGCVAPLATYQLLMQHDFITISGNQDRQIHEASPEEIASNPTLQFILDDLGDKPIDWLRSLPFDKQLNDDIYLCHGSPTSDLVYLLEDIKQGHARLRSDKEIMSLRGNQPSSAICCGHTHIPRTVELRSKQLVINPGSVGLPAYTDDEPILHSMENYSSHASYAIIEKQMFGWKVDHIKVPYDVQLAVNACKKRDRMDWAHFIGTGRKHLTMPLTKFTELKPFNLNR